MVSIYLQEVEKKKPSGIPLICGSLNWDLMGREKSRVNASKLLTTSFYLHSFYPAIQASLSCIELLILRYKFWDRQSAGYRAS